MSAVARILLLTCLLTLPAAGQPAATAPAGQDLLAPWRPILSAIEEDLRQWMRQQRLTDPPVRASVGQIRLTRVNLDRIRLLLARPIAETPSSPQRPYLLSESFGQRMRALYLHYLMLTPLEYADAETLDAFAEHFDRIAQRLNYLPLPGPQPDQPDQPAQPALGDRALRHNMLVRRIGARLALLRLLSGAAENDQPVLEALRNDLQDGDDAYRDKLDAVRAAVTELTPERAGALYAELRPMVGRYGAARREFVDHTALDPDADRPRLLRVERRPGADIARVVNLLATAAREPAIRVPGQ